MYLNVDCMLDAGLNALQTLFYLFLTTELQVGYNNLHFTVEEVKTQRMK